MSALNYRRCMVNVVNEGVELERKVQEGEDVDESRPG